MNQPAISTPRSAIRSVKHSSITLTKTQQSRSSRLTARPAHGWATIYFCSKATASNHLQITQRSEIKGHLRLFTIISVNCRWLELSVIGYNAAKLPSTNSRQCNNKNVQQKTRCSNATLKKRAV